MLPADIFSSAFTDFVGPCLTKIPPKEQIYKPLIVCLLFCSFKWNNFYSYIFLKLFQNHERIRKAENVNSWLSMSYNGSTTNHSNPFSKRTILNKYHSCILDYLHTPSVLLSEFSVLFVLIIWKATFVNFVSFLNIVIIRETGIFRSRENKTCWLESMIFVYYILYNIAQ